MKLLGGFSRDLASSVRGLRSSPTFALAAIATIAVGAAAACAIFSVADAVLFRPLPYSNPSRLVLAEQPLSNAGFYDLRDGTRSDFEGAASIMVIRAVVPRDDNSAERISKGLITTNLLSLLGARIVIGRDFTEADAVPQGPAPPPFPPPPGNTAILSYDYFQRRYNGDPAIIGRRIAGVNAPGPVIVGVVEPGFQLLLPARWSSQSSPDIWIANDRGYDSPNRRLIGATFVGRLRPGVPLGRALNDMGEIASKWGPLSARITLAYWQKSLTAEARPDLLALMGAVAFLVLIACANVANLLLVRTATREREMAMRIALGGTSGQVARYILAEPLIIVCLGTVAGVALAFAAVREIVSLAPANIPRIDAVSINWRVVGFAVLIGLAETVLLAALPLRRSLKSDLMQVLRSGGRSVVSGGSSFSRYSVLIAEVALAYVLLIGAGLTLRSFLEVLRVNPGFDPSGLLTFTTVGEAAAVRSGARTAFLSGLADRLRAIPGVQMVGGATDLPLQGHPFTVRWGAEREPEKATNVAELTDVLPGYFESLRSTLVAGRVFTDADNAAGLNLAVIDDALAAKVFPGQSALNKRICLYYAKPVWLEVIGVIRHQRLGSLSAAGREQIYALDGAIGVGISRRWVLRFGGDPASHAAAVRAAVAEFARGRLAVTEMQTMATTVRRAQAPARFRLVIIAALAAFAAFLAGLGIYGVIASSVRQRTAELGIRVALGATPAQILGLVIRQGIALAAIGVASGLAASIVLTRAISGLLVGVVPMDPPTFAAVTCLVLTIAAVASWMPARRAAALHVADALREGN